MGSRDIHSYATKAGMSAGVDGGGGACDSGLKHLSFLSHDLNNNLGAATLHLALLRRRLATSPAFADACEMLDRTQASIDHTIHVMRRLLAYGKLRGTAAACVTGEVNVCGLVNDVIAQHRLASDAKGIEVVSDVPAEATVAADAGLLVLVLQNLVGNGVKYSDPGVTVRVIFRSCSGTRGDAWTLSVSDDGPGIAPQQMARIFAPFRRGDCRAEDGMGLGLAIATEAARLLGTRLSVVSAPGVGSTFWLLPRRRRARRGAPRKPGGMGRLRTLELAHIDQLDLKGVRYGIASTRRTQPHR